MQILRTLAACLCNISFLSFSPFSKTLLAEKYYELSILKQEFSSVNSIITGLILSLFFSADLIMLGLATHEPNFTIIREEFKPNKPRPCALCGQMGHEIKDCQGLAREKQGEVIDSSSPSINHLNSMYELIFCLFSLSMMNLQTQFQYQNRSSYSSDCLCYERFVCSNLKK